MQIPNQIYVLTVAKIQEAADKIFPTGGLCAWGILAGWF